MRDKNMASNGMKTQHTKPSNCICISKLMTFSNTPIRKWDSNVSKWRSFTTFIKKIQAKTISKKHMKFIFPKTALYNMSMFIMIESKKWKKRKVKNCSRLGKNRKT